MDRGGGHMGHPLGGFNRHLLMRRGGGRGRNGANHADNFRLARVFHNGVNQQLVPPPPPPPLRREVRSERIAIDPTADGDILR